MSSAAVLEPKAAPEAAKAQLAITEALPAIHAAEHPMLVVSVAMVIAFFGAAVFVGSIVFWLMLRNSGVAHPLL